MESRSKTTSIIITMGVLLIVQFLMFKYMGPKTQRQQGKPAQEITLTALQDKEKAAGDNAYQLKNQVIKGYTEFANRNKGTEDAATALLQVAIITETKLDDAKHSNWDNAQKLYQQLLKQYSVEDSVAARTAKERLVKLDVRIDERNRTTGMGKYAYAIMDWLVNLTGRNPKFSYFFALLVITVVFKLVTAPLTHKQFQSMKEMQKLQPLLKQLQEKYKDNSAELGQRTMALYKEHGVNPLSGCLPMLIQMPVLILLYWMIRMYQYQFVHGEFLWIGPNSFSHQYPSIVGNSLATPDIPLLIIYVISMFVQQRYMVTDPASAQQQKYMSIMMPVIMGYMMYTWAFPSAFMLYWLLFNIFGTVQQYLIMKKPETGGDTPGGSQTGGGPRPDGGPGPDRKIELRKLQTAPGKAKQGKKKFEALSIPSVS